MNLPKPKKATTANTYRLGILRHGLKHECLCSLIDSDVKLSLIALFSVKSNSLFSDILNLVVFYIKISAKHIVILINKK